MRRQNGSNNFGEIPAQKLWADSWVQFGTQLHDPNINKWADTEDFKKYWEEYLKVGHILFEHWAIMQNPDHTKAKEMLFYPVLDAIRMFEAPNRVVDVLEVIMQHADQQVVIEVVKDLNLHNLIASRVTADAVDEVRSRLSKTNLNQNISTVTRSDKSPERKAKI